MLPHFGKFCWLFKYPKISRYLDTYGYTIHDIHVSGYQEKVVSTHPYVCSFRWELQTAARPSCHMHIGCIKIKGYHLHSFSNFLLKRLTISNNTACILQKIIQIDMNLFFLLADSIYILLIKIRKKSLNQFMYEITNLQVVACIWMR